MQAERRRYGISKGGVCPPSMFKILPRENRVVVIPQIPALVACLDICALLQGYPDTGWRLQNKEGPEDNELDEDRLSMVQQAMNEAKKQALEEEMERQMAAEVAGGGGAGEDAVDQRFTIGRGGEMIFKVPIPLTWRGSVWVWEDVCVEKVQRVCMQRLLCSLGASVRSLHSALLLLALNALLIPLQISSKYRAANSLKQRRAASKKILDMGKGVPVIGSILPPSAPLPPLSREGLGMLCDCPTRWLADGASACLGFHFAGQP